MQGRGGGIYPALKGRGYALASWQLARDKARERAWNRPPRSPPDLWAKLSPRWGEATAWASGQRRANRLRPPPTQLWPATVHGRETIGWLASALLDIEPRLRRIPAYRHQPRLREAIHPELGLVNTEANERTVASTTQASRGISTENGLDTPPWGLEKTQGCGKWG